MVARFAGELSVNGVSAKSIGSAGDCLTLPEGTHLTASVLVHNVGDESGSANICAQSGGRIIIERRTRELSPGESLVAQLEIGHLDPGLHLFTVELAPVPKGGQVRAEDHRALDDDLVAAVLVALGRAVRDGVSFRGLMDAIVAVAPPSFRWPKLFIWDFTAGAEAVRRVLGEARVESDARLRTALDELVRRLDGLEPAGIPSARGGTGTGEIPVPRSTPDRSDTVELEWEPVTGHWWSRWDSGEVGSDDDSATEQIIRIVAVDVRGPAVGESDEQLALFLHAIDDPYVDFGRLRDPAVTSAFVALAEDPTDSELRELAVAVVGDVRQPARKDWTADYVALGSIACSSGAAILDGTIAIVRFRGIRVDDGERRENSVVAVLSPTFAAAALLAGTPGLANGLIDVVESGAGPAEVADFEMVLSGDLITATGGSGALRDKRGVLVRAPGAGRTSRLRTMEPVAVGRDALGDAHRGRATSADP